MPLSIQHRPKFRIPYKRIHEEVLGKSYNLSLAFVDKKTSKTLNKKYRGKDYPTNVLSFPLEKDAGEVIIDLETAEEESDKFGMSVKNFVIYLFIHALLHLKGMRHGATMERTEKELCKLYGATHKSRHRHRDITD